MTAPISQNAPNIPSPDPSGATNERLAAAMKQARDETRGWVDSLQVLLEKDIRSSTAFLAEKIEGGLQNIGTRLDGNDTALVAALKNQKEETEKQTLNFKEIISESKKGTEKQIDSLNEKIEDLKKRTFESGGKSQGIGQMITLFVAAVAAIGTIGNFIYLATRPAPAPQIIYTQPPGNSQFPSKRQDNDIQYSWPPLWKTTNVSF
jgi:ferritin-like metal-binding protein YciE